MTRLAARSRAGLLAPCVMACTWIAAGPAAQAQEAPDAAAPQHAPQGQAAKPSATSRQGVKQTTSTPSKYLTGDWGGARTWLLDRGIDIESGFKDEVGGAVYGHPTNPVGQAGEFDLTATIDSAKLWGIPGGTFQTTITKREGNTPPDAFLLQQSLEVFGRDNIFRLTELWWRQKLLDDHLTIKFGRIPEGDFNAFTCDFMNLTFCGAPAGNLVGNYWYNWPIAQWTAWARYSFSDYYVMAGVNEDNPQDLLPQFSPGWFDGARGAIAHFELGWSPVWGGLQGHYQAGAWYDTAGGPDVLTGVGGQPFVLTGQPPLQRNGRYGFYIQGLQQITGEATYTPDLGWVDKKGLSLFFNFTAPDRQTATLDNQFTLGLFYAAPFSFRPDDGIGAAVGRTEYNSRAAFSYGVTNPGVAIPKAEYPFEAYYSYQATPWLNLRPDFQVIVHPGGIARASDIIVGLRSVVKF